MRRKVTANGDVAERNNILTTQAESVATSRQLVKKHEMAAIAGVSPRTLDTWIRERKVPLLKLSRRCHRFDPVAVMKALRRYEVREVTLR
jgi:hypothetical protein